MELTREEAIRLHRELWGWLAENPMKQKTDYPKFKTERVRNDCYLCEFADSRCAKCPVEWPKPRYVSPCHCMESYYGEWNDARLPEERSRLAALIRDLPEKKVESKPKFKVGDRVRVKSEKPILFSTSMVRAIFTEDYPEPKTVVIDNDGNRHIFNGPVTVLVGRLRDE